MEGPTLSADGPFISGTEEHSANTPVSFLIYSKQSSVDCWGGIRTLQVQGYKVEVGRSQANKTSLHGFASQEVCNPEVLQCLSWVKWHNSQREGGGETIVHAHFSKLDTLLYTTEFQGIHSISAKDLIS